MLWAIFALTGVAMFVTYSRLPAFELYRVTGSGFGGGASRVFVFLNYPAAIAAIAIVAVVYERLGSRVGRAAAIAAVALCTPVFWPGVVSQAKLDARPVNALCGIGVALAFAVTLAAPDGTRPGRVRGDRLRVVLAAVLLVLAPPWIAAELGFYLNGVPLLRRLYLSGQFRPEQPGLPPFAPAVHHGDHHGLSGVLLALTALLLSRLLPTIRREGLRVATAAYLSLMLAYAFGNIANDFWLEQVGKRGWTTWLMPSVLEPALSWGWAVIVAAAVVIWIAWFGRDRHET